MIAYESLNPANRIEAAAFIAVRYGDDTPSFYAVPANEVPAMLAACADMVASLECVAEQIAPAEALARFEAGAWIGIKLASAGGVAAWGRAIIKDAPAKSLAQIKAAAPLMGRKPQEFDMGALPLFGDASAQASLF